MSAHGQTIIQWMESLAPKHLAYEWDNVGLQVGSLQKSVQKVMVTLDVTPEVAQEAIENDVDLIIAHHPIIFRPLKNLRTDLPVGGLIEKLLQHNIAVYASHTNLDIAKGGVNDWLAEKLGLKNVDVLIPTHTEKLKKLIVFVPINDEAKVREALGNAGAGWIGNYSHCTFRSRGTGTFLPQEGTNPYIGEQGKVEQVDEVKLETIFQELLEKKVLQALFKAHPYEEVAYDIYLLDQPGTTYGLGRIGYLKEEMNLTQFTEEVKLKLGVPACRVVGSHQNTVKKVAVIGGSGSKYVNQAKFKGADVIVTGDVDYHTAHDAMMTGIDIIDPGHHIEKVMISGVKDYLEKMADENKAKIKIVQSSLHTEPFKFI